MLPASQPRDTVTARGLRRQGRRRSVPGAACKACGGY